MKKPYIVWLGTVLGIAAYILVTVFNSIQTEQINHLQSQVTSLSKQVTALEHK